MKTTIQFTVYQKMGSPFALWRLAEGFKTLEEAKAEAVEILKEKVLDKDEICIIRHQRDQYEAEDLGL